MDYLYDGTFEGLMTCVHFHYKKEKATGIFELSSYQQSIINKFEIIDTDIQKARTVCDAINNKISKEAYINIYYCYLSNNENRENIILDFLIFAFKYGKSTMNFFSHEKVLPINEISIKVNREVHKFLGILRFSDVNGILYSKISPDNDILLLIVDHFVNRYKYEKFIIHDEKRKKIVVYANEKWEIKEVLDSFYIEFSNDEKMFRTLWKQYFTDLAIKERTNISLQFQFVPARYRKNMVEFM
jgi:probable DNA metabolism protein